MSYKSTSEKTAGRNSGKLQKRTRRCREELENAWLSISPVDRSQYIYFYLSTTYLTLESLKKAGISKRRPGELVVYAANSKSGSVFEITIPERFPSDCEGTKPLKAGGGSPLRGKGNK